MTNVSENKHLVFLMAGDLYACPILMVNQIVEPLGLAKVPNAGESCRGAFNLRGQIICAVDLRPDEDAGQCLAYVIAETSAGPIALMVDRVVAVRDILPDQIAPRGSLGRVVKDNFVTGLLNSDNRMITIIDLSQVLVDDDLTRLVVAQAQSGLQGVS